MSLEEFRREHFKGLIEKGLGSDRIMIDGLRPISFFEMAKSIIERPKVLIINTDHRVPKLWTDLPGRFPTTQKT